MSFPVIEMGGSRFQVVRISTEADPKVPGPLQHVEDLSSPCPKWLLKIIWDC